MSKPEAKPILTKEFFVAWQEKKRATINAIIEESKDNKDAAKEKIVARIEELKEIITLGKEEYILWYDAYDKIEGRNGIAPSVRVAREKLITEPNFKIKELAEPKYKAPAQTREEKKIAALADQGFDFKSLKATLDKMKAEKGIK